ncbi:MAG: hypothetical protein HYX35_06745 [Proteobacteria bacterium]|nr:hypothetical protein [Pseudomonadota bacterium]
MKFPSFLLLFIIHLFLLSSPYRALALNDEELHDAGFWNNAMHLLRQERFENAGEEFIRLSTVLPDVELPPDASPDEYDWPLHILDKCYGGVCYLLAGHRDRAAEIAQEIVEDPIFLQMAPNRHLFTFLNILDMREETTAMARRMQECGDVSHFSKMAQVNSPSFLKRHFPNTLP